jgi:2-phospho-L-lactate guanylyltransferase (CobY/MobA/RfbA family)
LALDIDTPADVQALLHLPRQTHTQALLHELGVLARLPPTLACPCTSALRV